MRPAHSQRMRQAAAMLRGAGIGYNKTARILGVSSATVQRWHKPELAERERIESRARKQIYRGSCIDCGRGTSYSGKGRVSSERCVECRKAYERSDGYRLSRQEWPRRRVIAAIQDWADLYGEPPAMADWNPTQARYVGDEERALRWERANGRWPWFGTVVRRFGSWNAGIEAAGFAGRCNTGGCGNIMRSRRMRQKAAA